MARGVKKDKADKVLTPEERLAAALVPVEEQPYVVPGNWCWVKTGSACEFERGITFPASAKETKPTASNIPCLRTANIQDELEIDDLIYVDKSYMKGNPAKLSQIDDIIMSSANSRELVGKTSYVSYLPCPMTFGGFVLTIRAKLVISKYLFYFLRFEFLSGRFMGESAQTTNIANINTTKIAEYPMPFPSSSEQQRIVDRIESLFARLDEAKEKARAVVDGFEDRKAAILQKAFTGELTANWRKNKNYTKDDWLDGILSDACKVNPPKTDVKSFPDDYEVSFFPMPALSEIYGAITEPQTRKLGEVRNGFTNFTEGDVVFAKITPCMENGKSAVIEVLVNGIGFGTTEFYVLRCGERLNNKFLWHMVRDRSFRDEAKAVMTGAVGQQRVPKTFLENYPISLPPVEEQIEIVKILDYCFEKELHVKETAEQVTEQIREIKKSILARAFRGELGTNDPTDISAEEFLKEQLRRNMGMKLCRYCLHQMMGETKVVSGNHKRFWGYYNCPNCQALCDGLYEFGRNKMPHPINENWSQGTISSPSQHFVSQQQSEI